MNEPAIRDTLIYQAEGAFIVLMEQVDILFDLTRFYLDRYEAVDAGSVFKVEELKTTIDNIAAVSSQLGEILKRWKQGQDQVLSSMGAELSILNELWANLEALIYFLASHEIDLSVLNAIDAVAAFKTLVKCNRLLT